MSRRPSSSTSRSASAAAAPYPRRTPAQPKSSRQQFSACGACRMRRVRCDLKDFYGSTTSGGVQSPSCSNCRERSIKCVDEFAEVKAVKLLRRGRRLQQVEAVYGKVSSDALATPQDPTSATPSTAAAVTTCSVIPQLQLPFLKSSFFRRFCIQRPIIEPGEFASRYVAHMEGVTPLEIEGRMLVMLLVIWAASFGVDEFGNESLQDEVPEVHNSSGGNNQSNSKRHANTLHTEPMIREVLTLVDYHGLLRRPSWDGVRVLLLLFPLTHGILNPMERRTTYEATLSQVYSLCTIENPRSVSSDLGLYYDVLIRARIFWYAYVHEGITTGLDGGRLLLDDDNLDVFQKSLPPRYCAVATTSLSPSLDSSPSSPAASLPPSPTFPSKSPLENEQRAALTYLVTSQYFSLALDVAQVCRAIHSTLTGSRACRQIESGVTIRKEVLVKIWDSLECCWDNFEALRHNPSGVGAAGGDLVRGEDVERFVSGWQVFIFQCFNTIRQALSSRIENGHATPAVQASTASHHKSAIRWCLKFLPRVINVLQRHIRVPSNFFAYDAGLIHDGCFFAGLLLAQSDKLEVDRDMIGWDADWQDGVLACLQALGEIRWVYSYTQEREKTLRGEWEARIQRDTSRWRGQQSPNIPLKESPGHSPCLDDNVPLPCSTDADSKPRSLSLVSAAGQVRPHLPPLSVSFSRDDSGPDTVLTDDGSGSWEPYTPPPTSGSMTGTVVTHCSLSPLSSPHASSMIPMHHTVKFFEEDDDMDHLPFTSEGTPDSRTSVGSRMQARWTPFGSYPDPHVLSVSDIVGCDNGFSPFAFTRRPYLP